MSSICLLPGINRCARCQLPYYQKDVPLSEQEAACQVHSQEAAEGTYPCCAKSKGSEGCVAAPHLPTFRQENGVVHEGEKIAYGEDFDLHVGYWLNEVEQATEELSLADKEQSAPAAPSDASSSSSSSSSPYAIPPALYAAAPRIGDPVPRLGDEIMVCGKLFHTGTPVILWTDEDGYDHYRVERRFVPLEKADWQNTVKETGFTDPNRYGMRKDGLTNKELEKVRGGGWSLPLLAKQMKQLVLHYDECGTSRECFRVLHDVRDLSIHLMVDLDGTVYQACDFKERAYHATSSNTCSVGIEIANVGAYRPDGANPFKKWYTKEAGTGKSKMIIPPEYGDGGIHTKDWVGYSARNDPVLGQVQNMDLVQMDFTPEQYNALQKIVATFCTIFPHIPCDYPRNSKGELLREKLPDAQLANYHGILGHYHIQNNKIDPGPAFQWDRVVGGARQLLQETQLAKSQPSLLPSAAVLDKTVEWNLMRKMERKLLTVAEEEAAQAVHADSPFYLIDNEWWSSLQAWLLCNDASVSRPAAVSNARLLESDERTPRPSLQFKRDYRAVHARVWQELTDLYGAALPIIRPTTDIYQGMQKKQQQQQPADDEFWTLIK